MDHHWPRHYDVFFLGAMAGLVGSALRNLLELAAVLLLPGYASCVQLAGAILLDPACATGGIAAYLVGFEIDLLVSMVAGIVAVLILSLSGLDRLLLKGAIGGGLAWLVLYACLSHPLSRMAPSARLIETQISLLIHVIFGMTVVWTAREIDRRGAGGKRERNY